MALNDFKKSKLLKSRCSRNINGFIGVVLSSLIVLEIESLIHNQRITTTIFDQLLASANRLHTELYTSNKLLNNTVYSTYTSDNDNKIKSIDYNNLNLLKNLNADTIANFFNLSIVQRKNIILVAFCKECNNQSLNIINNFNIYGIAIASILALLCFCYAYNYDMKSRYRIIFVPTSVALIVSIFIYFILTLMIKIPNVCEHLPKQCDSDFQYHFISKIMPISIFMFVTSPQILFRLIILIIILFKYKKPKSFIYDYKFVKNNQNKTNDTNDTQQSSLINNDSTITFREVPIDCPQETIEKNQIASYEICQKINSTCSNTNNVFFFNFNELKRNYQPIDIHNTMNLNYYKQQPQLPHRRILTKYSSLSTIFEEKSSINPNSTPSIFSHKTQKEIKLNDFQLIKALLDDIHMNHLILNEILHVFQPSSKSGTFKRNIPVRLSSSKTKLNSPESTKSPRSALDSSLESKFSPISYNKLTPTKKSLSETSINNIHESINSSFEDSKRKLRLLKRLKNHIENIKGVSFCNISSDGNKNIFAISIFTNQNTKCLTRSRSENSLENFENNNYEEDNNNIHEFSSEMAIECPNDYKNDDNQTNNDDFYELHYNTIFTSSSNVLIDNNIRPVYF